MADLDDELAALEEEIENEIKIIIKKEIKVNTVIVIII